LLNISIAQYFVLHSTYLLPTFAARDNKTVTDMNIDNTKSQMRKGMLEYCILLLIHRKPAYANEIIRQFHEADMIVVEGTLYPLLTRLKKDGLLDYQWQESTQGPPRKYYSLTADGEEALAQLNIIWNELSRTVQLLGEPEQSVNP